MVAARTWLGNVLASYLALVAALGCERSTSEVPATAPRDAVEPVVDVVTTRAVVGAIRQSVSAPGSLVARRESHIGAELQGRIVQVYVSEGDRVEAGDVLFAIDPARYEAALRRAEAELAVARAEREQGAADLRRARELGRENVLSTQEIERLATSLNVAKARERRAAETVALARNDVERTIVHAPYAGSISERLADEGTTAQLQPQTIVLVLQETETLEAHATIPESQLALVQVGDPALVHVEGVQTPIETSVALVSDSIDEASRTYLVKMMVPNPDHRLKAGVFAHVEIHPAAKSGALLVPREALRTEGGRTRLLVVRDERAVTAPVEIGLVSEDMAEILTGIDERDAVVVGEAARAIAPGMRVRVVETLADAGS